eukprot:scaffold295096_cov32-Tisochrysis_lutea.AAC.4
MLCPIHLRTTSLRRSASSVSIVVAHFNSDVSGRGGGGWKPQVQFKGSLLGSYGPRGASNQGCAFRSQYRICAGASEVMREPLHSSGERERHALLAAGVDFHHEGRLHPSSTQSRVYGRVIVPWAKCHRPIRGRRIGGGRALHVQVGDIYPISFAHTRILEKGVLAHRHVSVNPLLQIVQVVKGAVKGHRVHFMLHPWESAVLEQPPIPIAPAHHLRHDHLPFQGAPERHQVDHEPTLYGVQEQVLVRVALVQVEYIDAIIAHCLGEGAMALNLDGSRRLSQHERLLHVHQRANQLNEAFVLDLLGVETRPLAREPVALTPRKLGRITELERSMDRDGWNALPFLE